MKNSILGKARWLRDVALATSKNNGARVAREWLKYAAMFVMLFTIGSGNAWGETFAAWSFTSSSYPSNKKDFDATSGTMRTSSTFYLNGSGSTWNSTKGYAFTAVTDITITLTLNQAAPAGTKITLSAATYYNKASNAPMKGFSIQAKEGTGSFGTTGLSATSWSLSSSSATKTVIYTTQATLASGTKIVFKFTQTGKAGSGQGYFNDISVSGTISGGSSCDECTYYVYNGTTWESIGTTGFDDVVLAPPTVPGNTHGAGNGMWCTNKNKFSSCISYVNSNDGDYRFVPNPGGAEPDAENKPGNGTCELYAVYFDDYGCLSTTVTAATCARIWEEPDNLAVSSVSSTGATLSWDAIDGVSSYHVIVTKVSNSSIVFDGNVNGTSKSLTGLTSGTEYSWKVAANSATNDACDSNFSDEDNFTTCASGFTSLTPTVTADKTGKNGGEALFELSGATSYSVTLKNNSTNAVIAGYNNVSNTSGNITFSGLTASTTYRVEVIAHNACGDNSQTGSETFTTDAATLYTVTFVNQSGEAVSPAKQSTEGGSVTLPSASPSTACEALGWTFAGWKDGSALTETNDAPTLIAAGSYTPIENKTFYAVFTKTEGGGGGVVVDEMTPSAISNPSSYEDWSDKSLTSSAVYAGQTSGGNNYLQLRSKNSNSGIIQTTSGGNVTKVAVEWNTTSTSGRKINVYGKKSSYEYASDLYDAQKQGTLIGTIVYGTSTELNINNDYAFIGFRSANGALYLNKVSITIGGGGTTYWNSNPSCSSEATVTYHNNGAKSGSAPTDANSPYTIGDNVTVLGTGTMVAPDGKEFKCWNTAADGTGTDYNIGAKFDIAGNMDFYPKWVNAPYTVTFDAEGGTCGTTSLTEASGGAGVTLPAATAPCATAGWSFYGWATSASTSTTSAPTTVGTTGATYYPTSTITLHAVYVNSGTYNSNPVCHEVTIGSHSNGMVNVNSSTTSPQSVTQGATVNIAATPSSGYNFTTWTITKTTGGNDVTSTLLGANATTASTSFTMPDYDVTVSATFTAKVMCTITWNVNGSTYTTGGPSDEAESGTKWSALTLPTAPADNTLSDCDRTKFVGWSTSQLFGDGNSAPSDLFKNTSDDNADSHTITGATTFYAVFAKGSGSETKWVRVEAGSVGFSLASISEGTYALVDADGYAFNGTISSGHGQSTGEAATFTSNEAEEMPDGYCELTFTKVMSGEDIVGYTIYNASHGYLYAQKAGSGQLAWHATETSYWYYYGSNWEYKSNNATLRTYNHTFRTYSNSSNNSLWLAKKTGGSSSFTDYATQCCTLKPVTNLAVSSTTANSVTLTWTAPSPTTGIDHLELRNASTDAKIGSDIAVGTTTTSVSGLVECNTYSYKIVSVGAVCETPSDVVEATPYSGSKTVTFNYNGGTGTPASFTTSCGNTTTTLPTPTRTNYRFDGWYTEASGGTRKGGGGDSYTPDATITLHAQWTRVYTVSYDYAGGSGSCAAGGPYAEGETVTTCGSATKAGSTLTGWRRSDNDATVTPGNTFAMPSSNVTLTAAWADTEYSLTQNVGSHTTKGHTGTTITSGMTSPSGLDLTYSISNNSYALPKTVTISGGGQTWTLGTNYTWELSADKHSATLHLGSNLTISANVTVTVAEQARYTVIWDEHGSTTTEYYAADDNTVTLKTGIADCGEKKFYGWTENTEFVSNTTTPPTMASSGAINGDKHYYAIYADATVPANPGYEKITSGVTAGTYIIATDRGTDYAYKAVTSHVSATVETGVISSLPTDATEVLVELGTGADDGYFAISYDNSGTKTYIYAPSSNNLNTTTTATYDWHLDSDPEGRIHSRGQSTRYLQSNSSASGQGDFKAYSSSQWIAYLYKKQTTTYKNFAKTCAVYDITITTPSGGDVTTTPSAGTGAAGEGQPVTVNVTPNSCKYLSALKYNDGSDHAISIASTPYTFTMPASDVTITATFDNKTVSSITPNTSTHRMLMEGTSFVGEEIRVTYNNGETEDLAWNDASLTFSGYNMSTLGEQTVSVAYSGSCGSANTSYSIEITDGIPVTFSDCGITTVRKYEPGDVVPVETTAGEYACAGWEFVGWSESSVAANSTSFTPVRNFNASTARTLYAVYANVRTDWISAFNTSELRGGATYVIVYRGYSYDYALLNTVASTNYLNGQQLATACSTITEPGSPSKDRYVLEVTPTAPMKWQLVPNGDYYSLYNAATNKYLKITTDQHALLTSSCEDKFTIANGYNDSQLSLKSFNASASDYYLYWYNSSRYFEGWTTAQGLFLLTNVETFSSNPPCAPQSAVFHGNGGTVIADGGSPIGGDLTIREATRDAGITTPTAEYEDCDGKSWSFIGWADHEVDVTRVPVLTTDLLNDGGGNKPHTIATDGEEFWAVYTNQGEPMTQYGTISFSMSDIRLDYHTDETEVTKTVPAMGDYTFGYKRVGHQSNTGIQLESGTGEFYNKTSLGRVNAISFNTFVVGGVNNLKVYVGDAEKSTTYELTAAELQVVGTTYTYYPSHNCEYVYIKNYNSYVCVEGISIEFGKGTKVWATTPDCKRVTLSGDIYATSTNGRGIMAVTPLRVNAYQLDPSAGIVITSNSSDVYFSTDRNANFAKAAANQPKTSVTVNAGLDGNLSKDIYVHYKPSSVGDGIPADVMVSANLAIPDPGVTASHPIHVRNLPEKFVIAAKVGATWYALPADMNAETNPSGVVIEVDETNMTATAPNTCSYTIWPVKTTNGEYDRYAINTAHYDGNAFGERVRFSAINNGNKGLWANNATSGNGIRNYAAITSTSDGGTTENTNPSYEWIITTTVADGQWQYTLQTDQTQNNRYLRYWSAAAGGPKWGTYASGEQNLYFLPVTEVEPFEMQVVEWYPTKVLIQTDAALASPTVKVNSEAVASPVLTTKGGKLWEISGLPLESNPTKSMTVAFTADEKNYACTKTVPIIISRGTKTQADAPFATLGAAIYTKSDVVVRDGAVLTVNGSNAANTFNDVTIYPTSKISVPSEKKLTVHALTFFGGIDEIYDGSAYAINKYGVPELSLKGTLHKSIAQIDYVMRVDDSQMYSLTVPYDVNLADITYWDGTSMGTLGDKLWVSAYDGAARAKKDMSHTWIWEANFASKGLEEKLKAGVGYTISADLQAGVGSTYSILRMPMVNNVANDGTELAKTVRVEAYGRESAVSDNHKGWNLVGNPYMVSISGGDADSKLVVGYLQETGAGPWEWVDDEYRYVTIPADNGQDYWQEKFSSATLKPFKNFFLQIATSGDLSFALASRQNSPARYLEAQKREVEFEINLANGSHEDHTGLLIAEQYSPAYEINADLEKMIGSMSVYTIYGGYNLAYNALSPDDAKQFIPIGYVAPSAGEYTFSLDDNSDVNEIDHIYLTDYQESVTVDLMEQDYIFMTTSGKNESRFAINATLKEETATPTDIDIINGGGDLDGEKPIKFIYHDKMYILRNGVLYDATGKKVREINK